MVVKCELFQFVIKNFKRASKLLQRTQKGLPFEPRRKSASRKKPFSGVRLLKQQNEKGIEQSSFLFSQCWLILHISVSENKPGRKQCKKHAHRKNFMNPRILLTKGHYTGQIMLMDLILNIPARIPFHMILEIQIKMRTPMDECILTIMHQDIISMKAPTSHEDHRSRSQSQIAVVMVDKRSAFVSFDTPEHGSLWASKIINKICISQGQKQPKTGQLDGIVRWPLPWIFRQTKTDIPFE